MTRLLALLLPTAAWLLPNSAVLADNDCLETLDHDFRALSVVDTIEARL